MKILRYLPLCLLALPSVRAAEPTAPPVPAFVVPVAANETIPDWQARMELARVLSYAHRYDESLAAYRRAIEAQPGRADLQAEYGQVLGWAGRTDDAIAVLSTLPSADLPPAAAILLADLLLGRKDFATSVDLYRRALAVKPDDAATRFKLARVLAWLKRFDECFKEYQALLVRAPNDVQLRRHYAQALGWAGQFEASIAEWRQTLPDVKSTP